MIALQKKATLFKKIREFFDAQGLTEVQTPSLLNTPTTDVYIDSIAVATNQEIGQNTYKYLHTSPELEMKKILSQGSGDIYQICQVFRDNEIGERNFNEFTLLEYYRLNFDIHQLISDISVFSFYDLLLGKNSLFDEHINLVALYLKSNSVLKLAYEPFRND